jgi:hypothetical protein
VKVSFISRFELLILGVTPVDAFRLAGTADLTVMKLSAICGREEYKDYFDLACIAKNADVAGWVSLWGATYPHVDPTSWIVALAAVDDVAQIPLDVFPPHADIDVQKVISGVVAGITKNLAS